MSAPDLMYNLAEVAPCAKGCCTLGLAAPIIVVLPPKMAGAGVTLGKRVQHRAASDQNRLDFE